MKEKFIAGVDIGGTWVRVAICTTDLNEENIKRIESPTLKDNEHSISNLVCQLLQELFSKYEIKKEQVVGIGLATAGPLDFEKGEIFNNANLGFKRIPLKKPIEEKFPDIPIYLINDCNAAVLGVHFFEAEKEEKDNLVYITLSTGVGGGVVSGGHLLLGKEGNAAEIGHGLVDPKSTLKCNCGAFGCWEVYSSGTGVKLRALDALKQGVLNADILMEIAKNDKENINAKNIFKAAKQGDELSKKIVNDCVFYLKVGIGLVNNFYDVSSVYLGGAMLKDEDQIIPPLIEQFEKDPITFTINHPPRIKVTRMKEEIGLRGALALVKYKIENRAIIP